MYRKTRTLPGLGLVLVMLAGSGRPRSEQLVAFVLVLFLVPIGTALVWAVWRHDRDYQPAPVAA